MRLITEKLYYKEPWTSECNATITGITAKGIVTDKTISFPEGGGQEGDQGTLTVTINDEKIEIPFIDTKKGVGRILHLPNFPDIQVETPIYHVISEEHLDLLKEGMPVHIKIDIDRRAKLTVSHTGIHIALMAIEKMYPELGKKIKGAHIGCDKARLDFYVKEKFTQEAVAVIQDTLNTFATNSTPIEVFHHPDEAEAWYWKCQDFVCPCGGTHLTNTKYLGKTHVKRKNLGKSLERISVTFEQSSLPLDLFDA